MNLFGVILLITLILCPYKIQDFYQNNPNEYIGDFF